MWLSVTVAVWAYLDWAWALGATLAVAWLTSAWIVQQALLVCADADGLRAGRSRIAWQWVAGAEALDAGATSRYLSDPAHHQTFLAVRPYCQTAVVITLADPADPHPAWIVSSRRPEALATTINTHVGNPVLEER